MNDNKQHLLQVTSDKKTSASCRALTFFCAPVSSSRVYQSSLNEEKLTIATELQQLKIFQSNSLKKIKGMRSKQEEIVCQSFTDEENEFLKSFLLSKHNPKNKGLNEQDLSGFDEEERKIIAELSV